MNRAPVLCCAIDAARARRVVDVDPEGRFHDVDHLYASDGSVLPSMGGVPPTRTILAHALRLADRVR